MNNSIHLVDYFPNYSTTNGLFQFMSTQGAPWSSTIGKTMDIAYFTMYSGIKNPSQFVKQNSTGDMANTLLISSILWSIYSVPWTKLWNSYKTEYNPINNYNIEETINTTKSQDRTITRTNDLTSSVDGTEKRTTENDATQGITGNTSSDTVSDSLGSTTVDHGLLVTKHAEADNFTYGFNSPEKVPTSVTIEDGTDQNSGKDVTTETGHDTSNTNGTSQTDSTAHETGESDVVTTSARADKMAEDTSDDMQGKEDIHRSRQGNVGQNSYQELLSQEFELWKWNFFHRVFDDCDKYLTLSVYSGCESHGRIQG